MEILYLDLWFALNLLCDYLLCLLTARAAGLYLRRRRYLLAALLGAAGAAAAYLPGFGFFAQGGGKLLLGAGMAAIAFGSERRPLRCALLFFAVAAAFGGALSLLLGPGPPRLSLRALLFSFLFCYGVGALLFRCHSLLQEQQAARVRLEQGGGTACFRALRDTGNRLRDPVSGASVLVASPEALKGVLGENAALFSALDPVSLLALSPQIPELPALRLLSFSSLGRERGLLPAFRPARLWIDGRERRDVLVAVSPQASGEGYEAIL